MDAAEDTREESQRLRVLPHDYGMLVRYVFDKYDNTYDSHKIAYGTYRWAIRRTAAIRNLIPRLHETRICVSRLHMPDINLFEQDHRTIKLCLGPMLGLKRFRCTSITIAGIELTHRIKKGPFNLGKLRIRDKTAPVIWNAVLAT